MINDSSGSGKDNRNLIAGRVEHDARSDFMMCPVLVKHFVSFAEVFFDMARRG